MLHIFVLIDFFIIFNIFFIFSSIGMCTIVKPAMLLTQTEMCHAEDTNQGGQQTFWGQDRAVGRRSHPHEMTG